MQQNDIKMHVLYYIADPMCSWCWGFTPALEKIRARFADAVELRYIMGGLARDSEEAMPAEVQRYVQGAWREVEARTGAHFNWEFWGKCQPRRSTYPSCRAVLAAGAQKKEAGPEMFHRIQRAYYTEARNPSDASTLVELAVELGLDGERFASDLASEKIDEALRDDFAQRSRLQANSFPSLVLSRADTSGPRWIARGWCAAAEVETALAAALENE